MMEGIFDRDGMQYKLTVDLYVSGRDDIKFTYMLQQREKGKRKWLENTLLTLEERLNIEKMPFMYRRKAVFDKYCEKLPGVRLTFEYLRQKKAKQMYDIINNTEI